MARARRPTNGGTTVETPPPDDWAPTQPVDNPILNKPYEEPKAHWVYEKQGGTSVPRKAGGRREARYFYKTKKVGTAQQEFAIVAEEGQDRLELVNRLRDDVRRWREAAYRGASPVTRELFEYWFNAQRARRLFFCQREAIETIVYLLEIAIPGRLGSTGFRNFQVDAATLAALLRGDKPTFSAESDELWPRLADQPVDSSMLALRRLGCKMATGSGKTVVMAMVISWALCNRGRNPSSRQFPSGVLVCAPNLTVRRRLQVLRPDEHPNYYEQFDLVPAKYREMLAAGKVLVTNWHTLALKSEHREGDASFAVVQKGEEPNDAFTKDRLGELAERLPILVLNDEGHHCWRPNPGPAAEIEELSPDEKRAREEDAEEARVWLAGLDRINNCGLAGLREPAILATIDLSATPFFLSTSGHPEGSPFPWLVSDFGLLDAIESGIVKIPRLPVKDDTDKKDEAGRPDPRYFRLWRHITEKLRPADRIGRRWKPDRIFEQAQFALTTLASQWVERFRDIEKNAVNEQAIPPVLIVVCESTELAQLMFAKISGEREIDAVDERGKPVKRTSYDTAPFSELQNEEGIKRTIRIDTKLLAKIETEEGESKDEAAQALRDIIDSVGKRGGRGEQVRCVVSVSMLTEGWDATNVTHILGVRAFDSQLLCEQVVGRGLRRMSYDPDPSTGLLTPEYVDVYGVPFSLIPYKGKPAEKKVSDAVQRRIFPVPEKAQYAMRMPIVESYTYDVRRSILHPKIDEMAPTIVDREEPTTVYLTAPRGYEEQGGELATGDFVKQTRDAYYEQVRWQQVLFRLTQLIIDDLVKGAKGPNAELMRQNYQARQLLFPQIVRVVDEYVDKKVVLKKRPDGVMIDKRELAHEKYSRLVSERIREQLFLSVSDEKAPLLPIVNSYEEFVGTEDCDFHTTAPIRRLFKSHMNAAVVLSSGEDSLIGESTAIDVLEETGNAVECFAPNHKRIGFVIYYEYGGEPRRYEPDFLVRMRGGCTVILEIKGAGGERHNPDEVAAKEAAARKWVAAVNNAGRYGKWAYEICRDVKELRAQLDKHAVGGHVLPFRRLERQPRPGDGVAVRLQRLKIAAGRPDRFQIDETEEWVVPVGADAVTPEMVIAQIEGDSMAPRVLPGEYCLFAPTIAAESGMIVLAELRARGDMPGGGRYVLKQFKRHSDGQVLLESINKTYEPIVVKDGDELRIVARFVDVLRPPSAAS